MPAVGSVSLLEVVWTVLFAVAAWKTLRLRAAFTALRDLPPVPGINERGQRALARFFVLFGRLLFVKCAAGIGIGVYAMLLPLGPDGGPAVLRAATGVLVPVLLCVMGGAVVWTAWALAAAYREIVRLDEEHEP